MLTLVWDTETTEGAKVMEEIGTPGNIYSGNKKLACLTNPTELAFRKGNLDKHYPVIINGKTFEDAESAYQFYTHRKKDDFDNCKLVCKMVLIHKLEQYPELMNLITSNGGLNWLEICWHYTYARTDRFARWEGLGVNSAFIKCLHDAYRQVKQESK